LAYDTLDEDTQFEERRQRRPRRQQTAERRRNSKGEALAFDLDSLRREHATGTAELQFEEARAVHRLEMQHTFPSAPLTPCAPTPQPAAVLAKPAACPVAATPTVHTRLAMDEVLSMFNEPLAGGDGDAVVAAMTPGPTPGRPTLVTPVAASNGDDGGRLEIFVDEDIEPRTIATVSRCCRAPTMPTPSASIIDMSRTTKELMSELDEEQPVCTVAAVATANGVVDPFGKEHLALVRERLALLGDCGGRLFVHHGKLAPAVLTSAAALPESGAVVELVEGGGKFDIDAGGPAAEGECSRVFRCVRIGDTSDPPRSLALKVTSSPAYGEWFISCMIRARVSPEMQHCFVDYTEGHFFDDASVLVAPFHHCGTLMNAIHAHQRAGRKMEETLCMYYTIEILRIVGALHAAHIIHADIKVWAFPRFKQTKIFLKRC